VRNYGGDLAIAPTIHITENDLEVILFEGRFTTTYLIHLFSIVSGRMQMDQRIKVLRAQRIDLEPAGSDPVHVQVDGEHVGVLPMRVSVEPGALNLLVPPEFLRGKSEAAA
jgi:diacylglycerol kinase (ATP)